MTDMRRTLLWVVFLMSIALLWDAWNKHNGQPSMFGAPVSKTVATAPAASGAGGALGASTAIAAPGRPAAPAPSETVVVTTDLVKASFDSNGGRLVRLELLKEKEQVTHAWYQPLVELVGFSKAADVGTQPNMVLLDLSPSRVYVAETGLLNVPNPLSHFAPMKVLPGEHTLQDGSSDVSISFASADEGVKLVKTFIFHRGRYTVDVRHELQNLSDKPVPAPQVYLQLTRDGSALPGGSSMYSTFTGPALYSQAKYVKADFKDIDKGALKYERTGDSGWVAMVQHYFASAWLHNEAQPREFSVRATEANDSAYGQRVYSTSMVFTLPALAPGTSEKFDAVLFSGPQEEDRLSVLAPGLELVKDYGIFKILAEPLFWLLTQLHKVLGNWGWSIIALVVLLRIAFYGLNVSAYRSMAKMKAINPRITEMRERLKDKPQQIQQEMMRIYREEKINPLGGCLPILVQMPFFISLYWVLLSSVEMRHAPWIGWISDLSSPDPYFILPLLMTASSLLQTWLNPTPPDPVQAKMMWIMPLAFSFMFFVFPSGLVLYWVTNNVLAIAQQWLINKQLGVLGK